MEQTNCYNCGAMPGELHDLGCDTERCYACGGQMLGCLSSAPCPHCAEHHYHLDCCEELLHDEERLPWTGEWSGVAECREFGWYAHFVPFQGHIQCDKDHPAAKEDLNRLGDGEATWSRKQGRYVLRATPREDSQP